MKDHACRADCRISVAAIWYITSQKPGVSALGLQRVLVLGSHETAWTMLHRLRRAMVRPDRELLHGEVEVDETYFALTDRINPISSAGRKSNTTNRTVCPGAHGSSQWTDEPARRQHASERHSRPVSRTCDSSQHVRPVSALDVRQERTGRVGSVPVRWRAGRFASNGRATATTAPRSSRVRDRRVLP